MKSLKKLIKELFYDTLYEADIVMRSDMDKNITKVTDNLRGLCGITICTVVGPAEKVSEGVERTQLRVKFFQVEPTLKQHLARMAIDARKIDGVYSFIPHRVRKVKNRIYRD
jgi:hypothetical protein